MRFAHLHPHAFTLDRDGGRGYFVHHDMPYPIDCALLGHKPTWVDLGTSGGFMECSRCTLRPNVTDEARRWTRPDPRTEPRAFMERALRENEVYWRPRRAETHLETSPRYVDNFSIKVKIGNAGSETPLDAHLIVPFWRGFYFGTSALGNRIAHWRSRRAPEGKRYRSKVWQFSVDAERVRWEIAANENESSRDDPKWMHGSWSWRDALCGKTVHEKVDGTAAQVMIPMPEGDYPAVAKPYRQTWTRKRFTKPKVHVGIEFEVEGGIPNGREKWGDWDSTWGFAVSADRYRTEGWETWAPLAAAARILQDRERYASADWTPPTDAMNPRMVARA